MFKFPETWNLKAQLVFGVPDTFERRHPRTYLPIQGERVLVLGA
jgi:predicted oxidoreductase (fatty acid repression mutant protein)